MGELRKMELRKMGPRKMEPRKIQQNRMQLPKTQPTTVHPKAMHPLTMRPKRTQPLKTQPNKTCPNPKSPRPISVPKNACILKSGLATRLMAAKNSSQPPRKMRKSEKNVAPTQHLNPMVKQAADTAARAPVMKPARA